MRDAHDDPEFASRLRAYCDGELASEEAAAIERQADEDLVLRGRIEGERALRGAVGRVMGAEQAPEGLADQVRAVLAAAPEDPDLEAAEAEDAEPAVAGRIGISWSAVAAVVVLITGAVLAGIFLPQIDEWGRAVQNDNAIFEAAAEHIHSEHGRCVDPGVRQAKLQVTADEAGAWVDRHLGVTGFGPADFAPLGYGYVGTGPCMVPGFDRSVHLLYQRDGGPMISVFVVANTGEFDGVGEIGPGSSDRRIVRVLRNEQVVLLVCCCVPEELSRIVIKVAVDCDCPVVATDRRVP